MHNFGALSNKGWSILRSVFFYFVFLGLMHEMHTDPKSEANLVCQSVCQCVTLWRPRDRSPRYKWAGR